MSTHQELLHRIIEKWGREVQINKLQEELLECALVINQLRCPTKDAEALEDQLYSELADVHIMMMQARILFDPLKIDEAIEKKLQRVCKYFNDEQ